MSCELARATVQHLRSTPTLILRTSEHVSEVIGKDASTIFREVMDYAALGGEILFGTDVGYHQRYNPQLEYESLTKAGLSWRQVLASLTTNPARRFNESNRRGRLAVGMDGDIVVLGADPRSGWQAFADVRYTIRAGNVIYQRPANR